MIRVTVDTSGFDSWLGQFKGQVPFATATAINETMKHAQTAQRAHQRSAFQVKNPRFVDQSVKIKPFATKVRLFSIIQIDPPGGQARASILTQHEEGGTKRPVSGRSLWVPEPKGEAPVKRIRKGGRGVPAGSGFRPRELDLQPHGTSGRVWRGREGIFVIRTTSGKGIVLQRSGAGRRGRASSIKTRKTKWFGRRSNVRALYALIPSGKLTRRLHFEEGVVGEINRVWEQEIVRALTTSLATAK